MGHRVTQARAIADALAAEITAAAFTGVEQVVGRLNLDPTPLSIDIYPAEPFFDDQSDGFGDPHYGYRYTVRARTHSADPIEAQGLLLDLMDAYEGLAITLEDDQTLNGNASSVKVDGPSGIRPYRGKGEGILIGCEWTVLVLPETS